MVRTDDKADSNSSTLNLTHAFSETAAILQRAAYEEEEIIPVFHTQISGLGLRGGILLLDESGEQLKVISAAEGARYKKVLKKIEKIVGMKAKGFSFRISDVDVYQKVVESRDVVFVPDSGIVIEQLIPEIARPIAGRIVMAFGGHPGIYAPLISRGEIMGVVNMVGEALTENDVPTVRAFANHVASALENARLYKELKESETHFRSIIENATIGFFQTHPDGRILFANPALITMLGFSTFEELSSRNIEQEGYAPPYSRAEFKAKLEQEGQIVGLESAWAREDGTPLFIRESAKVVRDSQGNITCYEGTVEDITDRKAAETALDESETRFRSLIEQSPISTILYTPDGRPIFGNEAAVKLWNISPELMESIYKDYNIFEDQQLLERGLMPYIERGFAGEFVEMPPALYDSSDEDTSFAGPKRWIKATVYPVKDQENNVREVVFMQEDVTESMSAEESLRESEERYRHIFENSAVSLWEEDFSEVIALMDSLVDQGVEDLRGYMDEHPEFLGQAAQKIKILDINETTLKMFGASSKEELLGSLDKIYVDDTGDILKEELLAIAEGRPIFGGETVNQTLQGAKKEILLTMAIPAEREKLSNVLVSVMDITRRVQAEKQLKRQLTELGVLNEVAKAGIEASNENELIARVTATIGEALYPKNFGVLMNGEFSRDLFPHPSYHGMPEHAKEFRVSVGSGSVTGSVAATGRAKLITDTHIELDYLNVVDGTQSELAVPLKIGDRVIGVINAESDQRAYFAEDDLRLITTIADQLSISIERLRNDAAEREQRQFNQALRASLTAINSTLDLDVIFDQIMDAVQLVVPYESANIMQVEGGVGKILRHRGFIERGLGEWADNMSYPLADFPIINHIVNTKQVIHIPNIVDNELWVATPVEDWIYSYLGAPILLEGEVIGVINLNHSEAEFYSSVHGERLFAFSDQVAIAINNARLYQDALAASDRRMVLYNASQEMIQASQDPNLVYESIHRAVESVMHIDAFIISLSHNGDGDILLAYAFEKGKRIPEQFIPAHSGVSGYVIDNNESIYIEDINSDQGNFDLRKIGDPEFIQSLIAIPLNGSDRTIGMLSAQSNTPGDYSSDDLYLLEMLGAYAGTVLENAKLYDQAQRRLGELESISHITSALREAVTVEAMLPIILDQAASVVGAAFGSVHLSDPGTGNLVAKEWSPPRPDLIGLRHKPGDGVTGHVAKTSEIYLTENLLTDPIADIHPEEEPFFKEVRANLTLPLLANDDLIGVMNVGLPNGRSFSDEEINLLTTIAHIAANAIRRAILNEKTQLSVRRLSALREIDQAITASLDINFTLRVLIDKVRSQLGVDAVDVLLFNTHTLMLEYGAGAGFRLGSHSNVFIRIDQGYAGRAAQERITVRVPSIAESPYESPRIASFRNEGFVSYFGVPLTAKGKVAGVLEIFHRQRLDPDQEWINFLETLAGQVAIAINNAKLYQSLQRANLNLSLAYDRTLEGWAHALELRDRETEGHSQRVTDMTVQLALHLGVRDEELVHIRRGVLLHDIGKMGIPDYILQKKGPLTDEEWEIMRRHPVYAYDMLSRIDYLLPSLDIPYCHHERWDGTGYPRGLMKHQIPQAARIFAIVDVWDALRSDRPYRDAWPDERVLEHLKQHSGTHFEPQVVDAFLSIWHPNGK
ncbi:MAG: GAF domain-containing protein [Anaerolineales bacterium]|nr:GAF domain-containing protein [Chloroflexota bacterium]MBL6982327.1 GAF domain-containing protein [Anaerolineales bacterium]